MMESLIVESPTDVDYDRVKKPISFLSLPPEIRNKIYRYSLVKPPSANPVTGLVQPPLTRVNRRIRSEALPIYYGNNQFLLDMDDADSWPNVIRMFRGSRAERTGGRGTGSLQSIGHLTCRMRGGSTETFLLLEVVLIDSAKKRARKRLRRYCRGWDNHFVYKPEDVRDLQHLELIYEVMQEYLREEIAMHASSVCRLISTIAMLANECPAVTKAVHFHYDRGFNDPSSFKSPFDSDINDS